MPTWTEVGAFAVGYRWAQNRAERRAGLRAPRRWARWARWTVVVFTALLVASHIEGPAGWLPLAVLVVMWLVSRRRRRYCDARQLPHGLREMPDVSNKEPGQWVWITRSALPAALETVEADPNTGSMLDAQ